MIVWIIGFCIWKVFTSIRTRIGWFQFYLTRFRYSLTIENYCNEFENSREVIFSKLVRVLDQQIFWLVRIKKRKRRFTRITWVRLSQRVWLRIILKNMSLNAYKNSKTPTRFPRKKTSLGEREICKESYIYHNPIRDSRQDASRARTVSPRVSPRV